MATVSEIRQAQSILFKIRSGISVRTDPRSTVGKLVNDALQRGLDLEQSLKEQLEKGLLEDKPKSKAVAEGLIAGEELQQLAKEGTGIVIVDGRPFSVPKEEQTRFLRQQFEAGKTQFLTGQEALRFAESSRLAGLSTAQRDTGTGVTQTFTIAKDVGRGRMQDFKFTVEGGVIVGSEPLGSPFPQSQRFIDRGRVGKSDLELVREAIGDVPAEKPSFLRNIFLEPSLSPSEIRELPRDQQGLAAAKSIFLGGLRGIQEKLKAGESLPSQVAGELTPTSAAELLVLRFLPTLPKPIQNVLLGGIAAITAPVVFEKDRSPSQRIAAGIIAAGASTGILINVLPTLFKSNIFSARFFPKGKIRLLPKGKKGEARFAELAQFFEKEQKKIRFEDVVRDLQFKKVGKVIRPKTNAEKIADIKKIIDEINRIKDPVARDVQMKSAIELFRKTYGDTEATSLIKDLITQEAPPKTIAELGRLPSPPRELPSPTQQIPFLSFLDKSTVSQLKPSDKQLFFTKLAQTPAQKQLQTQIQLLGQAQTLAQTPAQRLALSQAEALAQKQLQVQKQISKQVQVQRSALRGGRNLFFRARPKPKPKPKLKKIIIPKGVSRTKLVKALVKLNKQGVNVVVGMGKKEKIIARNLPPFKALKKGRDFVDENIAASFRLKKTGKKTGKKDIKPFNVGKKFRPSKRNVLFLVEKRKFRLDSPTERRQIKAAPGKKKRKVKRRKS